MLSLKNITTVIDEKLILNNINLTIDKNEIFGLVGRNGAGKTTLIKTIVGLNPIQKGEISVENALQNKDQYAYKNYIGYVPDTPYLYDLLTAVEYLKLVGALWKIEKEVLNKRIDAYLKLMQLYEHRNIYLEKFSFGMKQKVAICAALLHTPKILILDEPFLSLDPIISFEIKKFLKNYVSEGNIVFLSTHSLELVESFCTSIGVLKNGTVPYVGKMEEIKNDLTGENTMEEFFVDLINKNNISNIQYNNSNSKINNLNSIETFSNS